MPPKISGSRVEGEKSAGSQKDMGTSGKQGADYQTNSTRIAPKGAPSGNFDNSMAPKKKGY